MQKKFMATDLDTWKQGDVIVLSHRKDYDDFNNEFNFNKTIRYGYDELYYNQFLKSRGHLNLIIKIVSVLSNVEKLPEQHTMDIDGIFIASGLKAVKGIYGEDYFNDQIISVTSAEGYIFLNIRKNNGRIYTIRTYIIDNYWDTTLETK